MTSLISNLCWSVVIESFAALLNPSRLSQLNYELRNIMNDDLQLAHNKKKKTKNRREDSPEVKRLNHSTSSRGFCRSDVPTM